MSGSDTLCPACGHDKGSEPSSFTSWVRRLTGQPTRAAMCGADLDTTGWGGLVCECRHPHHGS